MELVQGVAASSRQVEGEGLDPSVGSYLACHLEEVASDLLSQKELVEEGVGDGPLDLHGSKRA